MAALHGLHDSVFTSNMSSHISEMKRGEWLDVRMRGLFAVPFLFYSLIFCSVWILNFD